MKNPPVSWGLALGAFALAGSLVLFAVHMPDVPVKVVPLDPPRLAERAATGAPEEAPPEEDPPEAVGTDNLPEQLDRLQLEKGLDDVKPQVEKCRALAPGFSGILRVKVLIARSGSVQSASALPPEAGTPIGDCVAKAVRRAAFPRYRGTEVPVTEISWPFYFAPAGAAAATPTTTDVRAR